MWRRPCPASQPAVSRPRDPSPPVTIQIPCDALCSCWVCNIFMRMRQRSALDSLPCALREGTVQKGWQAN